LEAQKELTDQIRMGLKPPPPAKVKISNLMRVLATQATMDPTRIEQEVRMQMEERKKEHEERNKERMLTPQVQFAAPVLFLHLHPDVL